MRNAIVAVVVFVVLLSTAFATSALADSEYEALEHDVAKVHPTVWRDTTAVIQVEPSLVDELMPVFDHSLKQSGTIAPIDLVPMSTSGYHPPSDPRYTNSSKLPVIKVRGDYALVIVDVVKGSSMWLKPVTTDNRTTITRVEDVRGSVQLLFPKGRTSVAVFDAPGGKRARDLVQRRAVDGKAPLPMFYDVVEVRDGYAKIVEHIESMALIDVKAPPPAVEVGWIRVRDDIGIVFWPVNPDTC